MHYGAEEMFFVVSGTPTLHNEKTRGAAFAPTRDPEFPVPEVGDKGIIARFELPTEE